MPHTAIYHFIPSLPFPHAIPKLLPPSAVRIHPNPPLFHITLLSSQPPSPSSRATPTLVAQPVSLEGFLPPRWELRYNPRGCSYGVDRNNPQHWLNVPIPQFVRAHSPPPTLHRLRTQPTQAAPTPAFAFPSDGRSAERPMAVLSSSTVARVRQCGMTLGGGDERARSAAIGCV